MNKLKVYIVGGNNEYANFLNMDYEINGSISSSDIIIFTGGEDVHPSYYGEDIGSKTSFNEARDSRESRIFNSILANSKKLMIGICRGAQFLTMKSGGKLIQHVSNHGINGTHKIFIADEGREIDITSTHHQMMYPFNLNNNDYKIIAHTKERLSKTYLNGNDLEKTLPNNFVEPEIVYYYKTNCLCIQGHPEYMPHSSQAVKFINMLILELLEDSDKNKQQNNEDDFDLNDELDPNDELDDDLQQKYEFDINEINEMLENLNKKIQKVNFGALQPIQYEVAE